MSIPQVDGLTTDTPVLGRHTNPGSVWYSFSVLEQFWYLGHKLSFTHPN